jgi:hypothetical protein
MSDYLTDSDPFPFAEQLTAVLTADMSGLAGSAAMTATPALAGKPASEPVEEAPRSHGGDEARRETERERTTVRTT